MKIEVADGFVQYGDEVYYIDPSLGTCYIGQIFTYWGGNVSVGHKLMDASKVKDLVFIDERKAKMAVKLLR
jgi:hypothetical protein